MQPGSERSFGLVFAAFFSIVGFLPLWRSLPPRWWVVLLAAAFLFVAIVAPRLLRPFNIIWFRIGLLLHAVVNPLIMGLIFAVAFVPIGLLLRLLGKMPLALKWQRDAKSYWIVRQPDARSSDAMRDQF